VAVLTRKCNLGAGQHCQLTPASTFFHT
jgi:hypothetical protein